MAPLTATGNARAGGFTYLSLLFFLAILGVGLAAAAISWKTTRQREKEEELLFAGAAIREAIALYYTHAPGGLQEFPKKLGDLVEDPRYPDARRYLRRLYRDPMTNAADWDTIPAPDGGIMGVRSRSTARPIKVAGSGRNLPDFGAAASYADWQFVYVPETANARASGPAPDPAAAMFPPVQSMSLSPGQ